MILTYKVIIYYKKTDITIYMEVMASLIKTNLLLYLVKTKTWKVIYIPFNNIK